MSYLESISLTKTLPCLAEPGKIIVIGKPNRLLNDVIPYLATLPGIIAYNPETLTLTFRRQPGFLTLSRTRFTSPRPWTPKRGWNY
jgi:ArsR family metal-binding transcriptional regulator